MGDKDADGSQVRLNVSTFVIVCATADARQVACNASPSVWLCTELHMGMTIYIYKM